MAAEFNAELYLKTISMQTGVTDVPLHIVQEIQRNRSASGVNQVYFEWLANRGEVAHLEKTGISTELTAMLQGEKVNAASTEVREIQRNIEALYRRAQDYNSEMMSTLRNLNSARTRLDIALGEKSKTALDIANLILEDPWWTLDEAHTKVGMNQPTIGYLAFTTPSIVLSHEGRSVDLGSYRVRYHLDNTVHVFSTEAFDIEGHCHPHISSNHSVCWGNAGAIVAEALKSGDPRPIMRALKIILQTYNHESPYVSLKSFYVNKHPEEVERLARYEPAVETRSSWEYGWLPLNELPSGVPVVDRYIGEGNEEEVSVRLYLRFIEDTYQYDEDGNALFYACDDSGTYHQVNVIETY